MLGRWDQNAVSTIEAPGCHHEVQVRLHERAASFLEHPSNRNEQSSICIQKKILHLSLPDTESFTRSPSTPHKRP